MAVLILTDDAYRMLISMSNGAFEDNPRASRREDGMWIYTTVEAVKQALDRARLPGESDSNLICRMVNSLRRINH